LIWYIPRNFTSCSSLVSPSISTVYIPNRKTGQLLRSAKDRSDRNALGMYRITGECSRAHVWQSRRSIEVMPKNTRYTNSWINQNNVQWQNIASWQGHCTDCQ
jgi:hypothetical protein